MGHPLPLFRLFLSSNKQYLQFLQKINVKNVHPVPMQRWDLNPQPYLQEFPPETTRPRLVSR